MTFHIMSLIMGSMMSFIVGYLFLQFAIGVQRILTFLVFSDYS